MVAGILCRAEEGRLSGETGATCYFFFCPGGDGMNGFDWPFISPSAAGIPKLSDVTTRSPSLIGPVTSV